MIASEEKRLARGCFWRQCRPSLSEFQWECWQIAETFEGEREACNAVGVSYLTWTQWRRGTRTPSEAARRAVWLVWVLVLHPERIQTVFDILTWGRFVTTPPKPQRTKTDSYVHVATEDYSI